MKIMQKFSDFYKSSNFNVEYRKKFYTKANNALYSVGEDELTTPDIIKGDRLSPDIDKNYRPCSLAVRPHDAIGLE